MTSCLSTWKCWCFSLQIVFGPPQKPCLWTEKEQKALARYIWRRDRCKTLRTQAVCRPTSQQNRQGKFELFAWTLSPNLFLLNWTFPFHQKDNWIFFWTFFPLTNLFLTFVVFAGFATTRVTMRFRAKNTGFSTGWPCGADGRTYGRKRGGRARSSCLLYYPVSYVSLCHSCSNQVGKTGGVGSRALETGWW